MTDPTKAPTGWECPNCGNFNDPEEDYCDSCGADVDGEGAYGDDEDEEIEDDGLTPAERENKIGIGNE